MKILAINNYSLHQCLSDAENGVAPAHHCWGIDYFISMGYRVDTLNYSEGHGKMMKYIKNFIFCVSNLRRIARYDCVITFANPIIGIIAFLRSCGLIHSRLFTVIHHYTRNPMLYGYKLNTGYEKIFFLSKAIKKIYERRYPNLVNKFYYLEWGADLKFYQNSYESICRQGHLDLRIISNGKTFRDLSLAKECCKAVHVPMTLISDIVEEDDFGEDESSKIINSGTKGVNAISYNVLLEQYMTNRSIHLIPLKKDLPTGVLCGLTSLLDALALGRPVIISDNSNISIDIEAEGLGLYYKAGNKESLMSILEYMRNNPDFLEDCGRNARRYAEIHSYQAYCEQLFSYIINNHS